MTRYQLDHAELLARLNSRRKAYGDPPRSWNALAIDAGVNKDALQRIRQGGTPNGDTLLTLMIFLGVAPAHLAVRAAEPAHTTTRRAPETETPCPSRAIAEPAATPAATTPTASVTTL